MSAIHFAATYDDRKLDSGLARSNQKVGDFARNASKHGGTLTGVFNKLGGTIGGLAGPAAALGAAFKFQQLSQEALAFENAFGMAMREVQTISKAVQDDFDGISDRIVDMAANARDNAIVLANAFYQIVSAGYDGEAGLKLLEISSKAATAGITDTKTAADGLTTVLNAWGISAGNAGKVADVMFKTVERGKTTFGELASAIAQVAPLAASNNIAFEEIFAAIQSITKQGTPTAQAMTQIRSSIINLNKALGDGWSDTMTYQEGLNRVAEMAGGSQNKLKQLIPDIEGVNAVLALTGEKARGAADDLDETTKAAGAMEKAYGTMMEEADNKWAVVHNKWTRELRALGVALKEGSVDIATFLDAMLSKPGDGDFLSYFENKINGFSDRIKFFRQLGQGFTASIVSAGSSSDSDIQSIIEKTLGNTYDLEVYKSKIDAIIDGNGTLEEKQKAVNDEYQQFVKYLETAGELDMVVKAIETTSEYNKKLEEGNSATDDRIEKTRTLKEMMEDLKALQDQMGTGTVSDDIGTLAKMQVLKDEIRVYYDQIRAERKDLSGQKTSPISATSQIPGTPSISKEQAKQEFQSKKILKINEKNRDVAQGQADAIKEQNDKLMRQEALVEGLKDGFLDTADILGSLSFAVGQFDDGLGQALGNMADIAFNASSLVDSIDSKNLVGALSSGIAIAGSVAGMIMNNIVSEEELLRQKAESVRQMFELQNIQLREQLEILQNSTGEDRTRQEQRTLELIKEQTEAVQKQASELEIRAKKTERSGLFGWGRTTITHFITNKDTVDEWLNTLDSLEGYTEMGYTIENMDELNRIIDEYKALVDARRELLEELTQTTSENISDMIADGLFSGKDSIADFADDFETLMKNALKNTFKAQYLNAVSKDFFEMFGSLSEGGLTSDEIDELGTNWAELITGASEEFDKLNEALSQAGIDLSTEPSNQGIAGQIARSITEDTGSEIAGLMRKYSDDIRVTRDYTKAGINHLVAIESNTYNTVVELQNAVSRLDQIVANTKPVSTSRDLGV